MLTIKVVYPFGNLKWKLMLTIKTDRFNQLLQKTMKPFYQLHEVAIKHIYPMQVTTKVSCNMQVIFLICISPCT